MALLFVILGIIGIIVFGIMFSSCVKNEILYGIITIICFVLLVSSFVCGCLWGFYPHKPSEGVHFGTISAVDREGYFGNKYKVYLKQNQFTTQKDETVYYLYNNETELAEKAKSLLGKEVTLKYSFPGGYISAWSAGEYHIYAIEIANTSNNGEAK